MIFPLFLITIFLSTFSISHIAANEELPLELTLNSLNETKLPRNFRIGMNASASGQFSEQGLLEILEMIPNESITIVDLREESHAYLNGHAVCWRTKKNWANRGKSIKAIRMDESIRSEELLNTPCVTLTNPDQTITIIPDTIIDEQTLAMRHGLNYMRIPVSDHRIPSDEEVDRFVSFYFQLDHNEWVHYHCSAGRGRSSLFMVMHDIMCNGDKASLDEILRRQHALGGVDFASSVKAHSWKTPYQIERMFFIHQFYQYVYETQGTILTWSEWTKMHS